jgi:hypothetical protein
VKRLAFACGSALLLASGAVLAEDKTAWSEIVTAETGDVYLLDPASIGSSDYLGNPVRKATILVRQFTGHPELGELWGVYLVDCDGHAWRHVMAMGEKRDKSGLLVMPALPEGEFRVAPEASPMRAVLDKVCSSEIKTQ